MMMMMMMIHWAVSSKSEIYMVLAGLLQLPSSWMSQGTDQQKLSGNLILMKQISIKKDRELKVGTWNVRSLCQPGNATRNESDG